MFLAAVVPFVVPAQALFNIAPVCEAKKRGSSCVLCGMTTAYVAIGTADFAGADTANAGALPLWSASVVNFQAAVAYLVMARRNRHFTGDSLCK
jgi:hypothetical protein